MRRNILLLGSTVLCALNALNAFGASSVDRLLLTDPITEAEKAFGTGDRRFLVVPVCRDNEGKPVSNDNAGGIAIPGWPSHEDTPEVQEAIALGRKPVVCKDLIDDPESKEFRRVANYAAKYNIRMYDLRKPKAK